MAPPLIAILVMLAEWPISGTLAQGYEVRDIQCLRSRSGKQDSLQAILKKPMNFQGDPFFPDNRNIRPWEHPDCQITRLNSDETGLTYRLKVLDFEKCKVRYKEDYMTVRVWFPQLKGVILVSDEDVVIMCKPAQTTVTKMKSAGFAGKVPQVGRVSGIVEKSPGSLEYALALHRESTARSGIFDLPLVGSIPIGTRVQLTASIDTSSAWKFTKLMQVIVSNDPKNPRAAGHIMLVENGCRNQNYGTIVPNQPSRSENNTGEVMLHFEAFMLENMMPTDRLWIHSEVKACTEAVDCIAQFCMDLFQPSGHGRKKRQDPYYQFDGSAISRAMPSAYKGIPKFKVDASATGKFPKGNDHSQDNISETSFDENIGISIVIPEKKTLSDAILMGTEDPCWVFVIASCTAGALLTIAIVIIICLSCRLSSKSVEKNGATSAMDSAMHIYRTTRRLQQNPQKSSPVETFTLAKRVGPSKLPNEAQLYVEKPGELAGNNNFSDML